MKGILLFNQLNDVLFASTDAFLNDHINKEAVKSGLLPEDHVNDRLDSNLVMQLFSPLITSQQFMVTEIKNPYQSIKCENGLLYVFKQVDELLALAIGLDVAEEMLQRKLDVFFRILGFLYGPLIEQIRPRLLAEQERHWSVVSQLLASWEQLYQDEQSFLVEALERLSVNDGLSSKCVSLLEAALAVMRTQGEKTITHALLFVQCKLLTLYSNKSAVDLSTADILLMMVLNKSLFPWTHDPGITLSNFARLVDSSPVQSSGSGSETKDDLFTQSLPVLSQNQDLTQGSTPVSPEPPLNSTFISADESSFLTKSFNENSYHEWTFLDDAPEVAVWNSTSISSVNLSSPTSPTRSLTRSQTDSDSVRTTSQGSDEDVQHYEQYKVFLKTKTCPFAPVILHVIEILPGIVLVLIGELPKASQASVITKVLSSVQHLSQFFSCCDTKIDTTRLSTLVSNMESSLKKFGDIFKKSKEKSHVDKLIKDVHSKWDVARKCGLSARKLKQGFKEASVLRLGTIVKGLDESVRQLFRVMFLSTGRPSQQPQSSHVTAVEKIRKKTRDQLKDYKDYLCVKACRNVTITSYQDSFPGLLHFIHINRFSGYLTTPSLHVVGPRSKHRDTTDALREQIWIMIPWIQQKLASGYTAITRREGRYYYSYYLWFEDAMGNPLKVKQPYWGAAISVVQPGILARNFYRELVESCFPERSQHQTVCCYELFCVHLGLVPTQHILSHCRKLATLLWENSNSPSSPFAII